MFHFNRSSATALCAAAVLGGACATLGAGAAQAHVSANAPTLTQGGYGVVTLVVPNESNTASTTSVTVTLPRLKSARPETTTGWKAEVTKDPRTQEATAITWTAEPGTPGVPVGQFAQFRLAGGPFPDQNTVELPAVQVYSDGQKVAWDQSTPEGGDEPEHPAPTLTLPEGDGHDGHHGTPSVAADTDGEGTDTVARWLGGAGLAVGIAGVAFGVAAGRRRPGGSDA